MRSAMLVQPRRRRRGNNAIEFALVMTFGLMPILFGTLEYGWFFFQKMGLTEAVSDAARAASVVAQGGNYQSVAQSQVTSTCSAMHVKGTPTVTAVTSAAGTAPNQTVTVTATIDPYKPITLGAASAYLKVVPSKLTATITMRLEDQP